MSREREKEQTDRQIGRQRERERQTDRHRQTDRKRQTERERDRECVCVDDFPFTRLGFAAMSHADYDYDVDRVTSSRN